MKKIISQCSNYRVNNPFVKKEPLKNKFMKRAFLFYKAIRTQVAHEFPKVFPLKEWQQYLWREIPDIHERDNSAKGEDANEKCFFNLKYLYLLELIPKEDIDSIVSGIKKFAYKYKGGFLTNHIDGSEYFKTLYDDNSYANLIGFQVNKKSKLYQYVSYISFSFINMTSSFCCLSVLVFLNDELKNNLSDFIVSNIEGSTFICGFENKKWYQIRHLGHGTIPGSIVKDTIFEEIIVDIKWNIFKLLKRFIPSLILSSYKMSQPSITSFCTNIDGNKFSEFWNSLSIYPKRCDFTEDFTGCIAWKNSNNVKYIFAQQKAGESDFVSTEMDKHLSDCLISYEVNKEIRKRLSHFIHMISLSSKKHLKRILKLKVEMDSDLFYLARYINEYDGDNQEFSFINLRHGYPPIKPAIIQGRYNHIKTMIGDVKKLYDNYVSILKTITDYKNVKEGYKLQRASYIIASISLLAVILTLVVTILSSESISKELSIIWEQIKTFCYQIF